MNRWVYEFTLSTPSRKGIAVVSRRSYWLRTSGKRHARRLQRESPGVTVTWRRWVGPYEDSIGHQGVVQP